MPTGSVQTKLTNNQGMTMTYDSGSERFIKTAHSPERLVQVLESYTSFPIE